MKTKISRSPKTSESEPLPNPAPNAAPEVLDDISRLSFAVDSEGKVLWDRMRGKTKDQLKAIIESPETRKALGIEAATTSEPVEVFDPAWTGNLYDAFGKMLSFGSQKIYHISPDIAEQAFTFSDKEKDKLAGPTAKVINKYATVWMIQFRDEIALAFLIVTITAVKLQMATVMMQARAAMEKAGNARPAVVPSPKPVDLEPTNLEKSVGGESQAT